MGLIETFDEGPVRILSWRDGATKNALNQRSVGALIDALRPPAHARVLVLRGLPDVFCSGADPATLAAVARRELEPADEALVPALLACPVPLIAAMEGHAVGGGLAVGLCADLALLAEESRYGCSFMSLGFTPGMGTTALLEEVMSPAMARELLLGGELRRGRELARAGFNHVAPRAELWDRALELARRVGDKPRAALRALKRTLSESRRERLARARTTEALMHEICFADPEVRARLEAEVAS